MAIEIAPDNDRRAATTCPCKWCGKPTRMLGTRMCDLCWELDRRIRHDPELAQRMLESLGEVDHQLTDTDILDCFAEVQPGDTHRNYLVAVGRAIEGRVLGLQALDRANIERAVNERAERREPRA